MKKDFKVIVLDLDGTLTNSKKEITPRNKEALMEAQRQGVKVVLASGRPTYGIVPLAEELELDKFGGYILSFNGGQIINYTTKETIYESLLPTEVIPELYNTAAQHGVTILSYDNEYILTENGDDQYVAKEAFLNKMPVKEVSSFVDTVSRPVPKCLIVGDSEQLVHLEEKMKHSFGHQMNIYRSEPFFLELMPQNIDKAYSLQKLLDHLKMDKEDMMACGDGFNDLSMIRFAGFGVAMANAQDAVKEVSDFITLSNEEDGVAHVVERFIL